MPLALATLLLFAAAAITASAQTGQPPLDGTITGIVTNDEGEAIQGASLCTEITYDHSSSTSCGGTQTDEHGQFSVRVPLGEIGIFAENQAAGYWSVVDLSSPHRNGIHKVHKVTLTRESPTVMVTLKIGPRPGVLKFDVKDKTTGKAVKGFYARWIGVDDTRTMSVERNLQTQMSIPAGIDVIVEVHAKGYRRWFYLDPSTSQPTLSLASGEEKVLNVELEPKE